jgi:hypothetical protein
MQSTNIITIPDENILQTFEDDPLDPQKWGTLSLELILKIYLSRFSKPIQTCHRQV